MENLTPSLVGHLLVALPNMTDPRFRESVIYVCVHNEDGAMGLVINRQVNYLTFNQLLKELDLLEGVTKDKAMPIYYGGPVEANRGFVLHTNDYVHDTTLKVTSDISLSATLETLQTIADGEGPDKCILALGYSGWGPGQLDDEIKNNGWLTIDPGQDFIFDRNVDNKWQHAIDSMGFDMNFLSNDPGHA
jgi:putative transcriptional regulator